MKQKMLMALLPLLLIGCTTHTPNNEVKLNATKFPTVEVIGDVLDKIVVLDLNGTVGKGSRRMLKHNKLVEVYLTVKNITKTKISFQYRFKWYDSQGFEIGDSLSIWKTKHIQGLSIEKIKNVAPQREAYTYKCLLKSAN